MKGKFLAIISIFFFLGCNDDCTKIIPSYIHVNNQVIKEVSEVPCDYEIEPLEPVIHPELENFTYEVKTFLFTKGNSNSNSRFQFEIKLNNPNNYDAIGYPILYISSNEIENKVSYSSLASEPCLSIEANSYCMLTLDIEESIEYGTETIELLDVKYFVLE